MTFTSASLKEAVSADAGSVCGLAFDIPHHVEEDLDRAKIGRRAVDELGDDRLALGDLATPAILGDDNELVERVTQQRLQAACDSPPLSRASGQAALAASASRVRSSKLRPLAA
jgi:hypothetical protein